MEEVLDVTGKIFIGISLLIGLAIIAFTFWQGLRIVFNIETEFEKYTRRYNDAVLDYGKSNVCPISEAKGYLEYNGTDFIDKDKKIIKVDSIEFNDCSQYRDTEGNRVEVN